MAFEQILGPLEYMRIRPEVARPAGESRSDGIKFGLGVDVHTSCTCFLLSWIINPYPYTPLTAAK